MLSQLFYLENKHIHKFHKESQTSSGTMCVGAEQRFVLLLCTEI